MVIGHLNADGDSAVGDCDGVRIGDYSGDYTSDSIDNSVG